MIIRLLVLLLPEENLIKQNQLVLCQMRARSHQILCSV